MSLKDLLFLLLAFIGIPILIFSIIKGAVDAKEQGNLTIQCFFIWLVVVITVLTMVIGLKMFL